MDFKAQIDELKDFLLLHKRIWQEEPLNNYPESLSAYPRAWVDELASLSEDELWKIDARTDFSFLKNTELLSIIERSVNFMPKSLSSAEEEFHKDDFLNIKTKKQHEIKKLISFLKTINLRDYSLIDICAGMGHLSRTISKYFNKDITSIDFDPTLQKKGKELIGSDRVHFVCSDIQNESDFQSHIKSDSFVIGLHTCGPLALKHAEACINKKANFLNFGCCYNKLDPKNDVNVSKYCQEAPLDFNNFSLTLATRSHSTLTKEEFLMKRRVKYYRYALHLLLYYKLDIKEFIGLGDGRKKDYNESFSHYAQNKLSENNIECDLNSDEIEAFYQEKLPLIKRMFCCNILRWFFGKPLEYYILLDRAQYLREQGLSVTTFNLFDPNISPRSIGILAVKGT